MERGRGSNKKRKIDTYPKEWGTYQKGKWGRVKIKGALIKYEKRHFRKKGGGSLLKREKNTNQEGKRALIKKE